MIAANISLRSRKVERQSKRKEEEEDRLELASQEKEKAKKEATNAKARAKRVRDREKVYKDFFKKIANGEMKPQDYEEMRKLGLNSDEIRVKIDQIMEWNDNQTVAK